MALTINDLKQGDEIEITRRVIVNSVDTSEGAVYEKGSGTKVRLGKATYSWYGSSREPIIFKFTRVKEAEKTIEHWPPQRGDVWELEGEQFHVLARTFASSDSSFYNNNGYAYSFSSMKKPGIKLVYRAGNSLK